MWTCTGIFMMIYRYFDLHSGPVFHIRAQTKILCRNRNWLTKLPPTHQDEWTMSGFLYIVCEYISIKMKCSVTVTTSVFSFTVTSRQRLETAGVVLYISCLILSCLVVAFPSLLLVSFPTLHHNRFRRVGLDLGSTSNELLLLMVFCSFPTSTSL